MRATPGADGVVRLPAIADGPFAFVDVKAAGLSHVTLLRDVQVGGEPVRVELPR